MIANTVILKWVALLLSVYDYSHYPDDDHVWLST